MGSGLPAEIRIGNDLQRSRRKLQQRRSRSSSVSPLSGLVLSPASRGLAATPPASIPSPSRRAKRLRLLHDLVPKAIRIAVLVNPANVSAAEITLQDVLEAAPAIGLRK
jgi:hypothetical protein